MPFLRSAIGAALLLTIPFSTGDGALAQIVDQSLIVIPPRPEPGAAPSAFARDRDVAVLDRTLPAFTAQGIEVGPFDLFPALEIAPEFVSNLYANNDRKTSAFVITERPEAVLRNRGGPLEVDLRALGQFTQAAGHSTENTEEGEGGIDLAIGDAARQRITAGASIAERALPRYAPDSPTDARDPLRYREIQAYLTGTVERGRFRLVLRGDHDDLAFRDAPQLGGGEIDTHDRNRQVDAGLARLEYALKPNLSVYVAGTINRIDYSLASGPTGNRDSHGYGAYLGTSFEVTSLARADVRVGYIRQDFALAEARAISGLGAKGEVSYFPTRLTTLTLRGERSVEDSGVPGTRGVVHTGGEVELDHELRRYLILTLIGERSNDDYRGEPRLDRNASAGVRLVYLSRDHWNARVGYQYNRRRCGCSLGDDTSNFDDHRVVASLTFQF